MKRIILAPAFLTLFFAQGVFAQDAGTGATTGSGEVVRTTDEIVASIKALAPEKNPAKLKDILVADTKQKAWEATLSSMRTRTADHRRDCRETIRRANRDQLMDRVIQCMRADLLLDVNMLRDQLQYVGAVPLTDAAIKASVSGAIVKLVDAEMAIIDGLDAGLFEEVSALEQAKKNLRATYREPVWLTLTRFRADRELTWVIFMAKRIEQRLPLLEEGDAMSIQLREAAICLETAGQLLRDVRLSGDRLSGAQTLRTAQDQLIQCRKTLNNVAVKERLAAEEKSKESESQNEAQN